MSAERMRAQSRTVRRPRSASPSHPAVGLLQGACDPLTGIKGPAVLHRSNRCDRYFKLRRLTPAKTSSKSAHTAARSSCSIVEARDGWGARLAEPGEFTLRAFLNGRIDLMQAEAVADLIDAVTPLQARAAFDQLGGHADRRDSRYRRALFDLIARLEASLDFPEEGYHFADPAPSLAKIDALLADDRWTAGRAAGGAPGPGRNADRHRRSAERREIEPVQCARRASRAIVTDMPGTTRDLVTETVDLTAFA